MDKKAFFSAVLGVVLAVGVLESWGRQPGVNAATREWGDSSSPGMATTRLAGATPRLIPFQAYLTDSDGRPITGSHALTFQLYTTPVGGIADPSWAEEHPPTPVSKGLVSVVVGSRTPFPPATSFDQPRFLEVRVDGGPALIPRQQIVSALFAADADRAEHAGHATEADRSDFAAVLRSSSTQTIAIVAENDGRISGPTGPIVASQGFDGFGIAPIGTIIAWHKYPAAMPDGSNAGTPISVSPPDGWMECNGQTLPLDSPVRATGATNVPDLNGGGLFMRGRSTSGTVERSTAIALDPGANRFSGTPTVMNEDGDNYEGGGMYHVALNTSAAQSIRWVGMRPANMSVVWIMRVK